MIYSGIWDIVLIKYISPVAYMLGVFSSIRISSPMTGCGRRLANCWPQFPSDARVETRGSIYSCVAWASTVGAAQTFSIQNTAAVFLYLEAFDYIGESLRPWSLTPVSQALRSAMPCHYHTGTHNSYGDQFA